MKVVKILFCCHLAALVFGLAGLLIALPHPELWDHTTYGAAVFSFGMRYAGSLHILLGAATMLVFGLLFIGVRKTLIFFAASTLISLGMELLGTSTGFPFGPYAYSDFLGVKILGHVPYVIPLSWFSMGLTSLLLAHLLIARTGWSRKTLWSLLLGVYFLTVWDLSLDPAMANANLPLHFWTWYESGPYFGMPISNLVGWSVTGLIYMSVSRLLWRAPLASTTLVAWLPFGMYAANTGFAIALNLSVGIFLPPLIGIALGVLPALLVFLPRRQHTDGRGDSPVRFMSHLTVRTVSQMLIGRKVTLTVEGQEWVPAGGPVLIAARHFHHLYDGCALLSVIPRRLHLLVAPDWIRQRWLRALMECACSLLDWPIVLRAERFTSSALAAQSAYSSSEVQRYLRRAVIKTIQLLRSGEALVIFPEGYPTIDPVSTTKQDDDTLLPFHPGFARLVALAESDGDCRVAIIPAGLSYQRGECWHIRLRFGPPLFRQDFDDLDHLIQVAQERVRSLSAPVATRTLLEVEEVIQHEAAHQ
jgi:uncharacterized membrane protein/1-acyl-sn-glycerol-3-phosphate acyltransferase